MPCTGSTSIFGMLRAALRKFSSTSAPSMISALVEAELVELLGEALGLGVLQRHLVDDDDAAVLGLGRQRVLERERAHLLRQVDGVAAHHRTEGASAAAELRHARRAVTGAAGALLRIHLLAGAPDFGAVLGLVGAALALGELPVDAALQDVGARLEAENRIRQIDRAGFLAFERGDFHFHVTRPPSRRGRRELARRPAWPRISSRRLPPGGTCRASAHPSAASSSPRRAR